MVDENDTEVTLINTVKGRRDLHAKREDRNQPMESQIESPDLFSSPPQVLRVRYAYIVKQSTNETGTLCVDVKQSTSYTAMLCIDKNNQQF